MTPVADFLRANARWLGIGLVLSMLSAFGQTYFISVFSGEIRSEYGLSHGQWGALYAGATMSSAAVMVFAGGIADHLRVRWLAPLSMTGLAIAALGMAFSGNLWALAITVFGLRLFGQGMMSHTTMVAMARWFVAERGRAVSIAALGFSVAEAFLPMTLVALMDVTEWRDLWAGAAILLLIAAPVVVLVLRTERTPRSFAQDTGSSGMQGRMWTRRDAVGDRFLWLMMLAQMGPAMWSSAVFFHQVHIAETKGWDHATLTALFPLFSGSAVVMLLVSGWLIDRLGSARMLPVFQLGFAAGYALFAGTDGVMAGGLALVFMGLSVGTSGTLLTTIWAEAYGTAHLGAIRALTMAAMVLGSALGPGFSGMLIDRGLGFVQQGWGVAVYFIATSLASTLAGRHLRLRARDSAARSLG